MCKKYKNSGILLENVLQFLSTTEEGRGMGTMNQCTNCGAAIADDDVIIWKCQECGKKYKIKMSKIQEMQKLKNRPENAVKSILRCRECGIDMNNGNEDLSFKCKECGKVIRGNLKYFASDDVDIEPIRHEKPEREVDVAGVNENAVVEKTMMQDQERTVQNKKEAIKKEHQAYKNKTNMVGKVFYGIGWCVIIFGTLIEFALTQTNYNATYSSDGRIMIITTFIVTEVVILISGLIPIGFAEIIFLLENIRDKLHDMDNL